MTDHDEGHMIWRILIEQFPDLIGNGFVTAFALLIAGVCSIDQNRNITKLAEQCVTIFVRSDVQQMYCEGFLEVFNRIHNCEYLSRAAGSWDSGEKLAT